jgi:hypothetical protein
LIKMWWRIFLCLAFDSPLSLALSKRDASCCPIFVCSYRLER